MKSLAELQALRDKMKDQMGIRTDAPDNIRIVVGMGTCGIAAGARPILTAINEEITKRNLQNVTITQSGCLGLCQFEPVIEVFEPGKDKVTYVNMSAEKAVQIIAEHIVNGNPAREFTIGQVK